MKRFNDLNIGTRIMVGFLIVVIIAGLIGGIGIFTLRQVNGTYKVAYTDSTAALQYTEQMSASFQRVRMNLFGLILAETPKDKEYYITRMEELRIVIDENDAQYRDMLSTYQAQDVELELQLLDAIRANRAAFIAKRDEMVKTIGMDPSRRSEAFAWLQDGGELRTLALAVDDSIEDLVNYNIEYAANQIVVNGQTALISTIAIVVAVAVGILLAIFIGLFISRNIARRIESLVEAAGRLALGDVQVNVQADSKDEIGKLLEAFAGMIQNIRAQALAAEKVAAGDLTVDVEIRSEADLLGKQLRMLVEKNNQVMTYIASAAEQVSTGSQHVSDSSIALSQGATEQASSVQQLSASMEEISNQTRQNADNANQANGLASVAKINAELGNDQMQEMVSAMRDINESSVSISKIIKVIDDIAFQTNILALNAAVEAARAGQHGKGFAVVAEEVRNLAARSANAAHETTQLIADSIQKVENGTRIANETADALKQIVEGIEQVANLVSGIATASGEQESGIMQINQGIMQVSQVVQTNAATSEESAAASEELAGQAELLKEQISKFKLKKGALHSYYEELDSAPAQPDYKGDKMPSRAQRASSAPVKAAAAADGFGKY